MRTKYATVKDTEGRVYEMQDKRLYQKPQPNDCLSVIERWITRASILRDSAYLHNKYTKDAGADGPAVSYDIEIIKDNGCLRVGLPTVRASQRSQVD